MEPDLSALAPPAPRARTTEDAPLPLRDSSNVSAFDASNEMVKAATKLTGLQIAQMTFEKISLAEKYDGIWACASLLHVERKNLKTVIINLANSLNEGGIIYSSFKYGETERQ